MNRALAINMLEEHTAKVRKILDDNFVKTVKSCKTQAVYYAAIVSFVVSVTVAFVAHWLGG